MTKTPSKRKYANLKNSKTDMYNRCIDYKHFAQHVRKQQHNIHKECVCLCWKHQTASLNMKHNICIFSAFLRRPIPAHPCTRGPLHHFRSVSDPSLS